jgi:hypothetical protein
LRLGGSENAPIILGCPFLATAKSIIYADASKIVFTINGKKERFNFKNKILKAHAHPRYPYPQEHKPVVEKREEIEGVIRRIIDLNHMWKKFGCHTGFKGKSECNNTCAPGSSYTHASTQ